MPRVKSASPIIAGERQEINTIRLTDKGKILLRQKGSQVGEQKAKEKRGDRYTKKKKIGIASRIMTNKM